MVLKLQVHGWPCVLADDVLFAWPCHFFENGVTYRHIISSMVLWSSASAFHGMLAEPNPGSLKLLLVVLCGAVWCCIDAF